MSKRLTYQGGKAISTFAEVYGFVATSTRIPAVPGVCDAFRPYFIIRAESP
jgi:hypothetical protein